MPEQSADTDHSRIAVPTAQPYPPADLPMVGRFTESEVFWQLLRRAIDEQQGQVLLVEGEAGIGKSRFLAFCRDAVASLPVRVLGGAYRPAGGAFAGLREALVELFGGAKLEPEPVAAAARIAATLPELGYPASVSEAADVATFLTQFLRPMPGLAGEPAGLAGPGAAEELRRYVIARMERFLRRASLAVPLLVLLEDLHWADAESLSLLQHLTSVLATDRARLVIIGTVRSEEREANPALGAVLPQMSRFEGTFQRRVLPRLGEAETADLIAAALQSELTDKAAIYGLAAGNPLHVLSILRYLESEALLERAGAGWRVKRGVRLQEILPPTVREVIGLRVERFVARDPEGPARQATLAWAAASGRRFDAEVLAEAMQEGAPHLCSRLDAHLDALLQAGFVRECPRLPGDVLEFDHDLLREVVLAGTAVPGVAEGRHHGLARAKVRRVERGEQTLLPEVAHHFLAAGEWIEAVHYHKAAGDAARDSLAFQEAVEFYRTAAQLLEEHPGLSLTSDERAGLYEAQADALEYVEPMDEALAARRGAQAELGDDPIRWARNERLIAVHLLRAGRVDEAETACRRAREVLEAATTEIPEVEAAGTLDLQGFLEIHRGCYDAALAHLQRALSIYQRINHRDGLACCYGYLGFLYHARGDLPALLETAQRELAIREELGSPRAIAVGLNNVAYALTLLDRAEAALPLLFRAVEILEQHRSEFCLPNIYHSLSEALLKCERGEEARPYLERGLQTARRIGEMPTVVEFHHLMARQEAAAGLPDAARMQYEEALRICAGAGLQPLKAQICLKYAEFLLRTGDPTAALQFCEEALAIRCHLGTEDAPEAEAAVARARMAASTP